MLRSLGDPSGADEGLWEEACPLGTEGPVLCVTGRRCLSQQIFNLMKFDSYTRFLKSPLYQECILAEVEGRPLPDAQQVPSSPASKHSASSDHSNTSTPKKVPVRAPPSLGGRSADSSRPCWRAPPSLGGHSADSSRPCWRLLSLAEPARRALPLHSRGSGRGCTSLETPAWAFRPSSLPLPLRDSAAASHCFNSTFPLTAVERKIEIRTVPE